MFGNDVKLSLFADATKLFTADLASVRGGLEIVEKFGKIAGLCLNVKKTKVIWLGKWANSRSNPLGMKWTCSPIRYSAFISHMMTKKMVSLILIKS